MAGDDTVDNLRNQLLAQIAQAIQAVFPRITGSFTMANAASKVVTQTAIAANSIVTLSPTNAAAGTLMAGANSLYHSANTAGASFTVATAGGGSAAGTETFNYIVTNPS